ncbi:MAG: OST-HTH/LOTUS domain-containing protein, partial [Lachnospiraceae bacterium]|nr:OST-HTH/LOTUS domain-containing protein [Lachnospiraceae bacterium]
KQRSDEKSSQAAKPVVGAGNTPSKRAVEEKIKQIIMENDDMGKATDLGQIGNELQRFYKNFDVRYYNAKGGKQYKYLKEFVSDFKSLEIKGGKGQGVYVSIRS